MFKFFFLLLNREARNRRNWWVPIFIFKQLLESKRTRVLNLGRFISRNQRNQIYNDIKQIITLYGMNFLEWKKKTPDYTSENRYIHKKKKTYHYILLMNKKLLIVSFVSIIAILVEHGLVRTVISGHHVNGSLVCSHHNGRVGYLSDQLRGQTAVQPSGTLFVVNRQQCLEKASVLGTLFAESGPGDLWQYTRRAKWNKINKRTKTESVTTVGVGDARSYSLGNGAGHHEFEKIFGRLSVVFRVVESDAGGHQSRFDCFVDDKVHNRFGYTEVRSGNAFIETFYSLRTHTHTTASI